MRIPALIAIAALAACVHIPEADAPVASAQPGGWPALVPLDELLARRQGTVITETTGPGLQARAAALSARAKQLEGPVIEPPLKKKMTDAAANPPVVAEPPGSG